MTLEGGDIVVAGTDGLFDNVFPEEAAALVRHARSRGEPAAAAARTLAQYTYTKSCDDRHMSPFAYAAQVGGALSCTCRPRSQSWLLLLPAPIASRRQYDISQGRGVRQMPSLLCKSALNLLRCLPLQMWRCPVEHVTTTCIWADPYDSYNSNGNYDPQSFHTLKSFKTIAHYA